MAIDVAFYDNTNGSWGTEYSLTNGSTTIATQSDVGMFQAMINFGAMVSGDQYRVRCYEKARSGDSQALVWEAFLTGPQSKLFTSPAVILGIGWDFTILRVAGSDRTITSTIRAAM